MTSPPFKWYGVSLKHIGQMYTSTFDHRGAPGKEPTGRAPGTRQELLTWSYNFSSISHGIPEIPKYFPMPGAARTPPDAL